MKGLIFSGLSENCKQDIYFSCLEETIIFIEENEKNKLVLPGNPIF